MRLEKALQQFLKCEMGNPKKLPASSSGRENNLDMYAICRPKDTFQKTFILSVLSGELTIMFPNILKGPICEVFGKLPHRSEIEIICRYTLGGFYLAKYDESPVGPFEEVSCFCRFRESQSFGN